MLNPPRSADRNRMAFLAIAGLLALLGWFLRNRQTRLERESKAQLREQATGIRSALLDITARVAAEQRMQRYLSDLEAAREELAADSMGKPVGPAELAAALERWLAKDSPQTTEPVFEKAAFLSRIMGDEDLARSITGAFLDDMPAQIEKLALAVAAGDIRKVELQAHQIMGASANVGGEALRGAAGEMEETSKAGRLEALRTLLPGLKERFAQLKEAMEKDAGGTV